jgi:hypothetical protein
MSMRGLAADAEAGGEFGRRKRSSARFESVDRAIDRVLGSVVEIHGHIGQQVDEHRASAPLSSTPLVNTIRQRPLPTPPSSRRHPEGDGGRAPLQRVDELPQLVIGQQARPATLVKPGR